MTSCALPNCPIATGGKCLDGFTPPESCPHFGQPPQVADGSGGDKPASPAFKYVNTYAGAALAYSQIGPILGRNRAKLISLAGPVDAGKTTLIAAIYEEMLTKRRDDFGFCTSQTLIGFEQRCHLARLSSANAAPDTKRTSAAIDEFLHLQLLNLNQNQKRDLIFSDISGERFNQAGKNSELAKRLDFLLASSRLILVINGGDVARNDRRFSAFSEQLYFLGMAHGAGMLANLEGVDVVLTKWDLVFGQVSADAVAAFRDKVIREVRAVVGDVIPVRFCSVASRNSTDGQISRGHGLGELVMDWLNANTGADLPATPVPKHIRGAERFVRHVTEPV